MVFSLLLSAIIWNLGTWYLGLPASSSHTLIGSIVGVGLMNSLLSPDSAFGDGVNWAKVADTVKALLFSPLIGFVVAAGLLLLVAKVVLRNPALFKAPEGKAPPPRWIRGLLVLTCTGVSFAHGSNDGQKGMGLIVLILVGIVPAAFALNLQHDAPTLRQDPLSGRAPSSNSCRHPPCSRDAGIDETAHTRRSPTTCAIARDAADLCRRSPPSITRRLHELDRRQRLCTDSRRPSAVRCASISIWCRKPWRG